MLSTDVLRLRPLQLLQIALEDVYGLDRAGIHAVQCRQVEADPVSEVHRPQELGQRGAALRLEGGGLKPRLLRFLYCSSALLRALSVIPIFHDVRVLC